MRYEINLSSGEITSHEDAPYTEPTLDDISKQFEDGIQLYLDRAAQAKGYDNITTACSYAGAENPFQAEAQSFITWRGNVWAYCYQQLDKVKSGEREIPTIEQIISELPPRL